MSDTSNIPQQEARELATRCAQILQHRFGARRVIPFGSVVGHGVWHPGSDIDLAKALIEDELAALRHTVQAVQEGLGPIEDAPSQFMMHACASYLHQFYTGCERILERIAVTVDGRLPSGAFSHANLLAQMTQELPGIRPAVLPEVLWLRLQDYLAFRHFFRHAYGYTLEWAKLRPLVTDMPATLADMQGQLMAFFDGMHRA